MSKHFMINPSSIRQIVSDYLQIYGCFVSLRGPDPDTDPTSGLSF